MEYQISVKLDEAQNEMIDRLAEKHDCSRAEAVRKAIHAAAENDDVAPQIDRKIDTIGETSIEILRLLQEHSEQSSAQIKNTRFWVQQSMFLARSLCEKFGTRESAIALMEEQLKKEEAPK